MPSKGHRDSKTKFATIFFDYKIAREIQLVIRGIKKNPLESLSKKFVRIGL